MHRIFYLLLLCMFSYMAQSQNTTQFNGVTLGPGIEAMMQKPADSAVVILTYHSPQLAMEARKFLADKKVKFEGPEFIKLPIQGVKIRGGDIPWLTQITGAYGIWPNKKLNGELHQAVIVSRVKDVWEDAAFVTYNGGLPITGRGVGVLINDSGFDGDDTDLQSDERDNKPRRIVQSVRGQGATWEENQGADNGAVFDTDQGGGHGTHCMGIVGGDGRKSNGKFTGVAPGAYLLGYGSGAGLLILDVDGGFEYVLRHGRDYNIKVMSNSFGTTSDTTFEHFDPSNSTSIATKMLADNGVTVVFSAGNEGPAKGRITGNYKTAPWVVCVANGLKTGGLASSSSRGRPVGNDESNAEAMQETVTAGGKNYLWENRPTVTAPGTDIVSVRATTGPVAYTGVTSDVSELSTTEIPYYTLMTGTSMACPHIAGIAALMLEANPALEWRAIKAILQRTSVPMTEKKWQAGAGYVNAHAAVAAAIYGLCNGGSDYNSKYGLPTDGGFGFDNDPWKGCALTPEVIARLQTTLPSIATIQAPCAAGAPPLTDPTGASDLNNETGGGTAPANPPPQFDIEEVRFVNETSTTFDIVLKVAGSLIAIPPGVSGTDQNFLDVHFVLDKAMTEPKVGDPPAQPEPQVAYIVSSFNEAGVPQFRLTVRSADGTTRPATNAAHYDVITGSWNTTDNTITWTVPKSNLNVNAIPAAISGIGTRTGRAAKKGDALKHWEAYTYHRVGPVTPDGPGVYIDKAKGQCFKELAVE